MALDDWINSIPASGGGTAIAAPPKLDDWINSIPAAPATPDQQAKTRLATGTFAGDQTITPDAEAVPTSGAASASDRATAEQVYQQLDATGFGGQPLFKGSGDEARKQLYADALDKAGVQGGYLFATRGANLGRYDHEDAANRYYELLDRIHHPEAYPDAGATAQQAGMQQFPTAQDLEAGANPLTVESRHQAAQRASDARNPDTAQLESDLSSGRYIQRSAGLKGVGETLAATGQTLYGGAQQAVGGLLAGAATMAGPMTFGAASSAGDAAGDVGRAAIEQGQARQAANPLDATEQKMLMGAKVAGGLVAGAAAGTAAPLLFAGQAAVDMNTRAQAALTPLVQSGRMTPEQAMVISGMEASWGAFAGYATAQLPGFGQVNPTYLQGLFGAIAMGAGQPTIENLVAKVYHGDPKAASDILMEAGVGALIAGVAHAGLHYLGGQTAPGDPNAAGGAAGDGPLIQKVVDTWRQMQSGKLSLEEARASFTPEEWARGQQIYANLAQRAAGNEPPQPQPQSSQPPPKPPPPGETATAAPAPEEPTPAQPQPGGMVGPQRGPTAAEEAMGGQTPLGPLTGLTQPFSEVPDATAPRRIQPPVVPAEPAPAPPAAGGGLPAAAAPADARAPADGGGRPAAANAPAGPTHPTQAQGEGVPQEAPAGDVTGRMPEGPTRPLFDPGREQMPPPPVGTDRTVAEGTLRELRSLATQFGIDPAAPRWQLIRDLRAVEVRMQREGAIPPGQSLLDAPESPSSRFHSLPEPAQTAPAAPASGGPELLPFSPTNQFERDALAAIQSGDERAMANLPRTVAGRRVWQQATGIKLPLQTRDARDVIDHWAKQRRDAMAASPSPQPGASDALQEPSAGAVGAHRGGTESTGGSGEGGGMGPGQQGQVPAPAQPRPAPAASGSGGAGEAPNLKPGAFSRTRLENVLLDAHEAAGHGYTHDDDSSLLSASSSGDAWTFYSKSGQLPGEVTRYIEGHPAAKRLFKTTTVPTSAGGEDAMQNLGDRYWQLADKLTDRTRKSMLDQAASTAESSNDPQMQLLAAVYKNLPPKGAKRPPQRLMDPKDFPAGTTFELNGHRMEIVEHENEDGDHYRLLKDGDDYPVLPVDQLDAIPVDKGTLLPGQANEPQVPEGDIFADVQDRPPQFYEGTGFSKDKGVFGQDVNFRLGGEQGRMFDTSRPAPASEPIAGSTSALDPKNTGEMFTPAPPKPGPVETPAGAKWRKAADILQRQIDAKRAPMTQNATPKRSRDYNHRRWEGDNLERLQRLYRAMADADAAGDLPPELANQKWTRDELASLVSKGLEGAGYYDVIPSQNYSKSTPQAKAAQRLIEGGKRTPADIEREKQAEVSRLEDAVRFTKMPGFFPTPPDLARRMVEAADVRPSDRVLEPSAGNGALADALGPHTETYEVNPKLAEILRAKGHVVSGGDFLEAPTDTKYDKIVMNPPFERRQDALHVAKAWQLLKPGGRLVALVSEGAMQASDAKSKELQQWVSDSGARTEKVPAGAFTGSGVFRQTGVATRMIVADKPAAKGGNGEARGTLGEKFGPSTPSINSPEFAQRKPWTPPKMEAPPTTGIKNETVAEERTSRGIPAAQEEAARSFGSVWDEAKAKLAKEPLAADQLVTDLLRKPRPVSDLEDALLLHRQIDLQNEYARVTETINAKEFGPSGRRKAPTPERFLDLQKDPEYVAARIRWDTLSDQLYDLYNVNKSVGRETARGLNARKMMAAADFSLAAMEARKRAANGGKPLEAAEKDKLKDLADKIADSQKAVDDRAALVDKARTEVAKERDLQRQIADLEQKIKGGGSTGGRKGPPAGPESRQVTELKTQRDGLRQQLEGLRNAANPPKSPQEKAIEDAKRRLRGAIGDTANRIADRDFARRPGGSAVRAVDPELTRLEAENNRLKEVFLNDVRRDQLKNRTFNERVQDTFLKWRRFGLLSNPLTIIKLTAAAGERLAITPTEEAVGTVLSKAMPGLAARAPREGGASIRIEARALAQGFTSGIGDAWKTLRGQRSPLESQFGQPGEGRTGFLEFMGNLHGALKAPVKRAEFTRSLAKRFDAAQREGLDVTDPLVQTRLGLEAYRDANASIFMQDNRLVAGYKRMVQSLAAKDPATGKPTLSGKAAATVFNAILPIVKVPTNLIAEAGNYTAGLPVGAARVIRAYAKGIADLPPEQADSILRNLKKGFLGAALLALGYFTAGSIGGFGRQEKKPKKGDAAAVPSEGIRIGGHDVPRLVLHNPLLMVLQMGATLRRVADEYTSKKDLRIKGIGEGAMAAAVGAVESVPFVREAEEVAKITDPRERDTALGETARSIAIPQAVEYAAKKIAGDTADNAPPRRPDNFWQRMELGIPGLRQNVPQAAGPSTRPAAAPSRRLYGKNITPLLREFVGAGAYDLRGNPNVAGGVPPVIQRWNQLSEEEQDAMRRFLIVRIDMSRELKWPEKRALKEQIGVRKSATPVD